MLDEGKSTVIVAGRTLANKVVPLLVDDTGILSVAGGVGGGGGGGLAQLQVRNAADTAWANVVAGGTLRVPVDGSGVTQPVSAASLPLPTGAATETTLAGLSAKLPAALVGGRLDVSLGASGITLPVSIAATVTADVSDRAARLLGVVYGSQGQQVKQTATNFNLQTEIAVGATLIDPRDVSDRTTRLLGHVTVDNATLAVTQSGTWTVAGGANVFHVDDNAGSLTVDAPVGTPVFVRLSDGAAALVGQKAMAASLPIAIASDQSAIPASQSGTWTVQQGTPPWSVAGSQSRGSATIPQPLVNGARASTYPTKPASVSAGQLVDLTADTEGVIYTRPRQLATYTAIYRAQLAAASSALSFAFTANTDKQLATIHHASTSTKNVRIRRVWVEIISNSVAGEVQFELRQLSATTQPATGNPAITPAKRDSSIAAADSTCLALPTIAGSEVASNSPMASRILNLGISAAQTAPPLVPSTIVLYDEASADDEEQAVLIRSGVTEGWAVIGRSTAATTVKFIIRITFTEE